MSAAISGDSAAVNVGTMNKTDSTGLSNNIRLVEK